MASNYNHIEEEDDDYIDMELSSSSNLFCHSKNTSSPLQAREFEFQKFSSISSDQESAIIPADELFYKGKLLPLHLPPRLQMLQNLLQNPTTTSLAQSCNVSPSESFRLTADQLNDHFSKWSTEVIDDHFIDVDIAKKSWSKKLKLMKKLLVGQKLKHVKSLFSKSNCSNKVCGKEAAVKGETAKNSKAKNDNLNKHIKTSKNIPGGDIGEKATFPTVASIMNLGSNEKAGFLNTSNISHRKSFSGAIKQLSSSSSSCSSSSSSSSTSSSFSFGTNRIDGLNLHTRRGSAGLDTELGSIESAIAHCKMSQQNIVADAGFWSFSVSRTADCIRIQET